MSHRDDALRQLDDLTYACALRTCERFVDAMLAEVEERLDSRLRDHVQGHHICADSRCVLNGGQHPHVVPHPDRPHETTPDYTQSPELPNDVGGVVWKELREIHDRSQWAVTTLPFEAVFDLVIRYARPLQQAQQAIRDARAALDNERTILRAQRDQERRRTLVECLDIAEFRTPVPFLEGETPIGLIVRRIRTLLDAQAGKEPGA